MAIELDQEFHSEHTHVGGDTNFVATGGQHIKMKTSPHGEELLDYVVPAGKEAVCTIIVVMRVRDSQ